MPLEPIKAKPQTRLIVLSAPSGAGKTTLCDMLLKEFPKIRLSISCTTRKKRPNETQGVHYQFLSQEQFENKVKAQEFAEWATVHGNYYGTLKEQIESYLNRGFHALFDIDVQGAISLRKVYGNRTLLIFIHPPSMEELQKRLVARKGDSATSIENRLKNAYNEVKWSQKFDYQLINENLESVYQELQAIILKECP